MTTKQIIDNFSNTIVDTVQSPYSAPATNNITAETDSYYIVEER